MLKIENIAANYGAIHALRGISMHVEKGEIVCLIGANGAGKSTLLNVVCGIKSPIQGSVIFDGQPLRKLPASAIVRKGLVQVPEGRLVFPDMTVLENLEIGAYSRQDSAKESLEQVMELFPRLAERKAQLAGLMSGGEQQMLAIGRALMAQPRLLLLDEPSMGLAPLVVADIFRTLKRLRTELNLSILLVEQNARAALRLADRGYVLTGGLIKTKGLSTHLLADSATQEAFLGRARTAVDAPLMN